MDFVVVKKEKEPAQDSFGQLSWEAVEDFEESKEVADYRFLQIVMPSVVFLVFRVQHIFQKANKTDQVDALQVQKLD